MTCRCYLGNCVAQSNTNSSWWALILAVYHFSLLFLSFTTFSDTCLTQRSQYSGKQKFSSKWSSPQLLPLLFCFLLSLIRVAISNEIFSRVYHYLSMNCGNKTTKNVTFVIVYHYLLPSQARSKPALDATQLTRPFYVIYDPVYILFCLFAFILVFPRFFVFSRCYDVTTNRSLASCDITLKGATHLPLSYEWQLVCVCCSLDGHIP